MYNLLKSLLEAGIFIAPSDKEVKKRLKRVRRKEREPRYPGVDYENPRSEPFDPADFPVREDNVFKAPKGNDPRVVARDKKEEDARKRIIYSKVEGDAEGYINNVSFEDVVDVHFLDVKQFKEVVKFMEVDLQANTSNASQLYGLLGDGSVIKVSGACGDDGLLFDGYEDKYVSMQEFIKDGKSIIGDWIEDEG